MLSSHDLASALAPTVPPCDRPWRALARLRAPSVELLSAAVLLGWSGLLLVLRPDLFDDGAGYAAMSTLAGEMAWGGLLGALGLTQLAAIVTRRPVLRLLGCGGACAAWCFIAIMLSQINGLRTGGITYGLLSAFLLWRNLWSDT